MGRTPETGPEEPVVAPSEAVPEPAAAPGLEPQMVSAPLPAPPVFGPYLGVLVYVIGYFVVGIVLAAMGAMLLGILEGVGAIDLPLEELAAIPPMDIEGILELMTPFLLHMVVAVALFSIGYTWAFIRLFERRRMRTFGLALKQGWLADFGKGALLALLVLGVVFAFSLAIGSIRVEGLARPAPEGANVVSYLVGMLVAFLLVGFYEELMFRGYVLQKLNERAGRVASVLVSSVIFALLHSFNPGADPFGVFNTIIIGAILCALFFRTGSLWMPIGFHAAWNFSLGYVYSLPVSGVPLHGILDVIEVDPDSRVTGGSYGPEAGLACTIALAAWGVWLVWRRTGRGPTGR